MKQNLLKISAVGAAVVPAAAANAQNQAPAERPNIVIFIADDLLTTELSCYGGRNINTPNIDRLAQEGVQFTNCYASEAMSVPIRASMYTGLYPQHHGSYQNHKPTFLGTKTVNEYMPEEGYRVGRTGKDHPGPKEVYRFDTIPGFTVGCTNTQAPYSCDGIEKWMSKSDDPFLLYVCSINTHAPWTWGDPTEFDADKIIVPENCVDGPEMREIMTHYLAEVRALDNEVGDVYKTLKKIGKLDNTIFMFLGEQGPQFPGGKWTLWYPGCHSALLVRYPARIKAGTTNDALVQYEDILPTCLDIAGGAVRPELDGVSFKNTLFNTGAEPRQYVFGIHNNYPEGHPYPIRSIRDKRYALLWNLTPEVDYHEKHLMKNPSVTGVWEAWEAGAARDERNKFWLDRFVTRPEFEFYDLKKDPWEEHNLINVKKHAKRIEKMKAELMKWMEEMTDTGVEMDPATNNEHGKLVQAINDRKRAVLVKDGWIRDPYIVLGPDGYYYLSGTTPKENDPREQADFFNTGLGEESIVGNQLRLWRSENLADWEYIGSDYFNTWTIDPKSMKREQTWLLWAPEIKWTGKNWVMMHCPQHHSHLVMTEGADITGPWKAVDNPDFNWKHDPSLFQDEDGKWYVTYGYHGYCIQQLKDDFSGWADEPVAIDPCDRTIGHEGTLIKKIGGKYVFFGTAWSTDQGRKGSYNLYYCTSDNIYGPYGPRKFVGRFLGHGTPFQDKFGRWWCTAFYNANVPPLERKGIQKRDLSETAQTINKMGTTLVPLDVKILEDGDIYIRAIDPDYAVPGPEEVQKFE